MPKKLVSRALEQPLGITGNVSITGNLALQGNILFAYNNNNRLYGVGNILYYKTATETFTVQNTAVIPAVYGGSSKVPVFTVDSQGRLTSAANVNVAGVSGFSATGNSFTISTADGSSFIANLQTNSVRLAVDTTGDYVSNVLAGTGVTITGQGGETATPTIAIGQAVSTSSDVSFRNLTLSGNLIVSGNVTTITSNTLIVNDPLIQVGANNNISDTIDLGFFGHYYGGTPAVERHAGLFRDASDGIFKLFANLDPTPGNTVDVADPSFRFGSLDVEMLYGNVTGTVSTLSNHTTANLTEGTNLYFTNARVYANVNQIGYAYISQVAVKANVIDLTTANVAELTNLYYTNARARTAISVTGSGTYDNSTGIITVTGGVTSVGGATGTVSNVQLAAGLANTTISNLTVTGGVNFNSFTENVVNVSATTANTTIDWSLGAIFDMNLAANTTVTFTNPPPAMRARTISIVVRPTGTGVRTITVQRAKYTDGITPVLSLPGNIDMLSYMTIDGGNSYFGSFVLAGLA